MFVSYSHKENRCKVAREHYNKQQIYTLLLLSIYVWKNITYAPGSDFIFDGLLYFSGSSRPVAVGWHVNKDDIVS